MFVKIGKTDVHTINIKKTIVGNVLLNIIKN